jgi:hypothetical protein
MQAKYFAARLMETAGADIEKGLDQAFLLALARRPSVEERQKYKSLFAGKASAEAFARLGVVLFNLNEFIYLE